jgi:hypothetical protein
VQAVKSKDTPIAFDENENMSVYPNLEKVTIVQLKTFGRIYVVLKIVEMNN